MKLVFKDKGIKIGLAIIAVVGLVIAGFLLWNKPKETIAAWWNDNWSYRKAIVINHQYVEADLTDFPVLISLTDANLGTHAQADGDDITFIDTEGKKLKHEIESFATTTSGSIATGTLVAWVKAPELSSTDDTVIYMYYGNAGVGDQSESTEVWDENYMGVWHMDNEGGASTIDSTANSNHGTTLGPVATSTSKINSGLDFEKNDPDTITITNFDPPHVGTLSFWIKPESGGARMRVVGGHDNYEISRESTNLMRSNLFVSGTGAGDTTSIATTSEWTYIVYFYNYNTNNTKIYINSNLEVNQSDADTDPGGPFTLTFGTRTGLSSDYYDGILDEVRISRATRTSGWIKTSYNNQNNPAQFLAAQAEETGPGPVGYWTFDKGYGTTAYDESGQGNDGTIYGAEWREASQCVAGKCLWFDGSSSYVESDNDSSYQFGLSDFTVSAWVRSHINGNFAWNRIVDKECEEGWSFYGVNSHNYLGFCIDNLYVSARNNATNINDNSWHHVVVVVDRDDVATFYVDGKIDGDTFNISSKSSYVLDDPATLRIGKPDPSKGETRFWDGFIDEVKIYPYARSADEIKQDYAAGLAGAKTAHGVSAAFGGASEKWMTDGLVGYWQMDESATTSGAFDTSGNGNTGVYYGDASTTAGKFGNGGVFDGDGDYVFVPNSSSLDLSGGNFTFSIWFKADAWKSSTLTGIITKDEHSSTHDWVLFHDNSPSEIILFVGENVAATLFDALDYDPSLNDWHHIVVTRTGNTFELWGDGESKGTEDSAQSWTDSENIRIGSMAPAAGDTFFEGLIDEVRIYNRALSPREVRKLYEWAPGPFIHLKMDEKSGNKAYDNSGHGNDGTITGAVWTRGKYGNALEFKNGDDDRVTVAGAYNTKFTITAWIKPYSFGQNEYGRVMQKGNVSGGFGCYPDGNDDSFQFYAMFDNVGGNTGIWNTPANSTELNKWQHVAVSYEFISTTTDPVFYINGVKLAATENDTPEGVPLDSNSTYYIGNRSTDRDFDGIIDEFKLYNYIRTQKQIIEDMNAGHPAGGSPVGSEVLYLKFDEGYGATAYDSSPQKNNGTLFPGTTGDNTATSAMWSLEGKFGRAIEFDGSGDYVDVGTNIPDLTEATWAAWVKPTAISIECIIGKWVTDDGWLLGMRSTWGNKLGLETPNDVFYYSDSQIELDVWTHVAATADGNYVKMYINGVLDKQNDQTQAISNAGVNTYIGTLPDFEGSWWFNGLIDDVRIYPFALNEDEIKLVYNQGKSAVMGSLSTATTTAGVHVPSNAASRAYCVPGSNDYCAPPVLELKMDEKQGTTTYDTSGQGNDGVFVTNATSPIWRGSGYCQYGNCLEFDGVDDYVDCGTDSSIRITQNLTLEAWVRRNSTGAATIISKFAFTAGNYRSYNIYFDSGDQITFKVNKNGQGGYDTLIISSLPYTSTTDWYHVVGTYQGVADNSSIMNLYVNGQTAATEVTNAVYPIFDSQDNEHLYIGVQNSASAVAPSYFNGLIDHVKIYDYVRTPAQIAWEYNKGKPVGYWKFDECSGGTIYDQSGNGNNGTLQLGTSGVTATGTCASSSNSFWYNGRNGKINAAGSFDGTDDCINFGDNQIFERDFPFSVVAWINLASLPSSQHYGIASKYRYNGDQKEWIFRTDKATNTLMFTKSSDGTTPNVENVYGDTALTANDLNIWKHAVVIIDSNANYTFYLDGRADGTGTFASSTVFHGTAEARIGCSHDADPGDHYFDGLIDEVKIFNYALTEEQVKTEYNSGAVRFGN